MEIALYVLLGILLLWGAQRVLTARLERNMGNGADAGAIRAAVQVTGAFDGTPAAQARAREVFVDLAENGQFEIAYPQLHVDELAEEFSQSLSRSSGPILLEAAWTVVGAHRVSFPAEALPDTAQERDAARAATALFAYLFKDWTKAMTRRYRVATPAEMRETQLRMAMAIWLMLDLCERRGIAPASRS